MSLYDELYDLFARRYHPLVAAIMAHEYARSGRHINAHRFEQRLQRQHAA